MGLSTEQIDVYLYAVEVKEQGCKAMDHESHAHIQASRGKSGASPLLDWSIDYFNQLPAKKHLAVLVDQAHRVGVSEGGAVGGAMKGFYNRLHKHKLYTAGVRYLRMKNQAAA